MANVLDDILESFHSELSESDTVKEATVEELRALFSEKKTLKADDFVAIFVSAAGEASHDSD